jgi:hypothetical protein
MRARAASARARRARQKKIHQPSNDIIRRVLLLLLLLLRVRFFVDIGRNMKPINNR